MQDLKIVMSSRVDPHLKEMLEEEAANEGSTLSSYLEQLLIQREKIVLAESLQSENAQLQETLEASETEHDRLLRDNEKLQQAIKLQKERLAVLEDFDWLGIDNLENLSQSLNELSVYYGTISKCQLLQVVLATSIQNEQNSWKIYKIEDFLRNNPNFLTHKSIAA